MIIFESFEATLEESIIFKAAGAIEKKLVPNTKPPLPSLTNLILF